CGDGRASPGADRSRQLCRLSRFATARGPAAVHYQKIPNSPGHSTRQGELTMIRNLVRTMQTAFGSGWRFAGLKQILITMFLSFALAVPFANAACGGKNLMHGTAVLPSS